MVYYNGYILTKEECDEILNSADDYTDSKLGVAVNSTEYGVSYLPKKRKSTQCSISAYKNSNLYNKINEILKSIDYEFVVDEIHYDVIKYKVGDFIWKHTDGGGERRYTLSIQLNNGSEYEGGDFKYWENSNETILNKDAGYGAIFKADTYHEVTEITNGIRYSFVLFIKNNDIKKISKPNLF
jgi:hypothetical protein